MAEILRVESARHLDGSSWELGKEILVDGEWKEITKIQDMTAEFHDSVDRQYDVYVGDKLVKSLVNMPVVITYK
ncbi:hypothetical protein ACTWQB_14710 [Piscibacillus sp. B03]|uniref:hypothetical protein n=1 Tax=Piscibacillus sp. B03 TaxID=3457430 RepID=UPI003FCD847F